MAIVTILLLFYSTVTAAVAAVAAWFAMIRHFAQIDSDRQRRITESFSKSIEQLGSEKMEVRVGGIYALRRISVESPNDYWTVMENLTAFVRERSRRNAADIASEAADRLSRRAYFLWQEAGQPAGKSAEFWTRAVEDEKYGEPPVADIDAALTVIMHRSKQNRDREQANGWRLDLSGAVLRQANFRGAHLEKANLAFACLEKADFREANLDGACLTHARLGEADFYHAHLNGADLRHARLERANLWDAHLNGAKLNNAHLKRANLGYARLEGAYLWDSDLEGTTLNSARLKWADLQGAHLEFANLVNAQDMLEGQLLVAHGDASTKLPAGIARPAHWPAACADVEQPSVKNQMERTSA